MTTETKQLLTERMRKGTKEVHDTSDKLVNLKLGLVLTSKPLYAEAISLFEPVYCAIEAALERQKDHPQLQLLYPLLGTLRRAPEFEKDIQFFLSASEVEALQRRRGVRFGTGGVVGHPGGDTGKETERASPAELQNYLDHLASLEKECPIALLAYTYHMYMAIFAGGYLIKKMVRKAMGLTSDEGVATFTFPEECDTVSFRREFKDVVNTKICLTDEEVERVLQESSRVFAMNNALVATVKDTPSFATARTSCILFCAKALVFVLILLFLLCWFFWASAAEPSHAPVRNVDL